MKIKFLFAFALVFLCFGLAAAQDNMKKDEMKKDSMMKKDGMMSKEMMKREKPVSAGELAPDFTLEDENGNKVSLSDSRGKDAVVLVFYRGYW
jgi:pentapeptide MXKDX repeat protein